MQVEDRAIRSCVWGDDPFARHPARIHRVALYIRGNPLGDFLHAGAHPFDRCIRIRGLRFENFEDLGELLAGHRAVFPSTIVRRVETQRWCTTKLAILRMKTSASSRATLRVPKASDRGPSLG